MQHPSDSVRPPPPLYYGPDPDTGIDSSEIHLWDYVQVVLQRLPLVVFVFILVMLVAALYTWTRPARYTATARLLLDPGQVNLTDIKGAYDPSLGAIGRRDFMETQVQLIKSRPVLEAVINGIPEFDSGTALDPVLSLTKRLQATALRNTHLIEVAYRHEDPRHAARVVNAVINRFIESNRARRLGISEEGLEELRQRADQLRVRLTDVTHRLQEFMVDHNMVSFERTQNLVMDRLRDLNRQLTQAQPKRMSLQAEVEAVEAALREGKSPTSIPRVMESRMIGTLQLDIARTESEYSQSLERLGENHPRLIAMRSQIEAWQNKITIEALAIRDSLKIALDQMLKEERMLEQAIQEQEQQVYRFNQLAAEYEALRRTRDSIEAPYNTIIRRIEEIDINRIGGQGESMFIAEAASTPKLPSWPNKRNNMLIAFVLAGAFSVGLCFFLDYMDTTLKSESDVHRYLSSRTLAAIPNVHPHDDQQASPDTIVLEKSRSHAAEAFRALRTSMLFSRPDQAMHAVVVSSTLPSEGKSMVASNLAAAQALAGRRVLLIDADMRKPRLHKIFGVDSGRAGLSDCLRQRSHDQLEAFTVPTTIERLSFMPCGHIPSNPAELLESDDFPQLLTALKERFDFLVIDSPPGYALVDSTVMARHTDGLLLVVRSFSTPKDAARQFVERLHEAKIELLGICLNLEGAPKRVAMYGYYGRYGRYGRYGYYSRYGKYYSQDGEG